MVFLFSCKNSGPDIISSSNTQQSKAPIYYGVMTVSKNVLLDDGSLSNPTGELQALFSASPLIANNVIGSTSQDVGAVSINNIWLNKTTKDGVTYYEAPLNNFLQSTYLCSISGADDVKPFSYKMEAAFPDYLGYSLLPDTVNTKSILLLKLADITNADEVEIFITDRLTNTPTKNVSTQAKTVSFSLYELSHLSATPTGVIVITCYKTFYETFNGKKYKFRLGYKMEKYNVSII